MLVLERVLARQSVAEAADDLGLSPSATSRALQRLREALDDPLLVRAGNGLTPTERAQQLAGPAVAAVEAARAVFRAPVPFHLAEAEGDFVLALGPELQEALLPAIVADLQEAAPGLDLQVRELTLRAGELAERDLLHLALGPDLRGILPPERWPDLTDVVHTPVYDRRFVVVGAPAFWDRPLDLAAYAAARHVIMSADGGARGFMDDLLEPVGVWRRVACTVSTFGAGLRVVRETDLLALVPSEILPTLGPDLVQHPPPVAVPPMAMQLMWHPRHTTQPRHRALRRRIASVVEAEVGGPGSCQA